MSGLSLWTPANYFAFFAGSIYDLSHQTLSSLRVTIVIFIIYPQHPTCNTEFNRNGLNKWINGRRDGWKGCKEDMLKTKGGCDSVTVRRGSMDSYILSTYWENNGQKRATFKRFPSSPCTLAVASPQIAWTSTRVVPRVEAQPERRGAGAEKEMLSSTFSTLLSCHLIISERSHGWEWFLLALLTHLLLSLTHNNPLSNYVHD